MQPQVTIDTQEDGGTPNSCAVSCHGDGLLGAPTFGLEGTLGTWNEEVDVSLAKRLLQPRDGDRVPVTAIHRAVVTATVMQDGLPVSGIELAFSRSTSGRKPAYDWTGTTGANGQVKIVADGRIYWRTGASGYYMARATDASGEVIGNWGSIPINGGKEIDLSLPIGGPALVTSGSTLTFALAPNSPNPFNPSTQIDYQIPEAGQVRLTVFNVLGQQVRELVSGHQDAGPYSVLWDGRDGLGRQVASGTYFYRLVTGPHAAVRRMVMVK
jgi:hypothetical protein